MSSRRERAATQSQSDKNKPKKDNFITRRQLLIFSGIAAGSAGLAAAAEATGIINVLPDIETNNEALALDLMNELGISTNLTDSEVNKIFYDKTVVHPITPRRKINYYDANHNLRTLIHSHDGEFALEHNPGLENLPYTEIPQPELVSKLSIPTSSKHNLIFYNSVERRVELIKKFNTNPELVTPLIQAIEEYFSGIPGYANLHVVFIKPTFPMQLETTPGKNVEPIIFHPSKGAQTTSQRRSDLTEIFYDVALNIPENHAFAIASGHDLSVEILKDLGNEAANFRADSLLTSKPNNKTEAVSSYAGLISAHYPPGARLITRISDFNRNAFVNFIREESRAITGK